MWGFQTVHHDIWDYDVASQPTLVTVQRDGQEIPALAQATKMGLVFLLNRETGPKTKSIPLDATLVRGSHGVPATSPNHRTALLCSAPGMIDGDRCYLDTDAFDLVLNALT